MDGTTALTKTTKSSEGSIKYDKQLSKGFR